MLNCIFDLFERYQTFIVGIVGFIGVIYTIRTNATLMRNQHEREINHEQYAIRTALVEELKLLSDSYVDRIAMFEESDQKGTAAIPRNVPNDAYLQLIPKIGLLTPKEIKLVMTAYQLVNELPNRLEFMAVKNDGAIINPAYINIDNSSYSFAAQLHKNFLGDIKKALSALNDEIDA